ncbi:MAG: RluA family pseudouridine synthase [Desulfobulbus sp.]|nr:RluA family pseudouridine synthase [Desulfobulbus sp.]
MMRVKTTKRITNTGLKKAKVDTFTVSKDDTLLPFLIAHFPQKGRNVLKALLRDRMVSIDGLPVGQFNQTLTSGSTVEVRWERDAPREKISSLGLDIIFEDTELVVINKPSGLLTIATDTEKRKTAYSLLSEHVKLQDHDNKIFVVHRLDRDTSGLLLFAKNSTIKQQMQETWETTVNQRTYVGVVEGVVEKTERTIISWLAETSAFRVYSQQDEHVGKKAITHYRKIGGNSRYSLLLINLDTGRKHQIRVHMQDIGHPIVGDKKYGSHSNPIHRMALHAQVLEFVHPTTGQICRFETPIPENFQLISSRGK